MRSLRMRKGEKKCGGVACHSQNSMNVHGLIMYALHQWLYLGSPEGFRQTNYYKSSHLRKFFVACCKYCNLAFMHCLFGKFVPCLLFCFTCLNLDSGVFHSDFCLASFLLFKCLLPTISFSFSYNLNLNIKTTRFPMQPSVIIDFHIFVYMLSFLTDIVFYYNLNLVQPAIRLVSLKI